MKISKNKGLNLFDHNDDGPDASTFGSFVNSILSHHNPNHSPPPTPHVSTLEFRSIDGSGNNLTTPTTNAAGFPRRTLK